MKTIHSKTPKKIKQFNALARARSWHGSFLMVKRAVIEAANAYPISDIQWFNLQAKFGSATVKQLREIVKDLNP